MIVGEASIVIMPDDSLFASDLKAKEEAMLGGFGKDADKAGKDAGEDLRGGVKDGTRDIESDLGEAGIASGAALRDGLKDGSDGIADDLANAGLAGGAGLRDGVRDGAEDMEKDLSDAGLASGAAARDGVKDGTKDIADDMAELGANAGGGLRKGVEDETGKLADDLEEDGEKGGDRLSKGLGSGLSKLGDLVANTGLPLGGLSSKLDETGKSLQDADVKAGGFTSTLSHLGGYALLGVAAGAGVAAVAGVKMAEGMQTADAAIASAGEVSSKTAKQIGNDFLDTAGKSTFSGEEMAKAYAGVAAQLKATEGHALSAGQATHVMAAASDLAEAKQMELGAATSTLSSVMQAFGISSLSASQVSDTLYQASNLTSTSVEELGTQLQKVRSKLGETSPGIGALSGLLVDMAEHGVTGRAAMSGLNTGMNTLLKSGTGVATAIQQQNTAYEAMSPSLKKLAKEYESGSISAEAFKKQTSALPPEQAGLAESFAKASTAVQTAQLKYKEMGLTVFNAQGQFVGMGSVIEQLYPRFAKMSQQQQLATASTLFGAGAARQMVAVINAGPEAYGKATAAVEKHGAAEEAARKQAETLHGEEKTLGAELVDVGTKIGEVLIPAVTKMVADFVQASTFVLAHKAILIGLAAVISGPLAAAITVFTVNKLVAFGQGWVKVGSFVQNFAGVVKTAVGKVVGLFAEQEAASTKMATKLEAEAGKAGDAEAGLATKTTEATDTIKADYGTIGASAGTAASDVETADGEMVAANSKLGESFSALAGAGGPIALAVAALYGMREAEKAVKAEAGGLGSVIDKIVNGVAGLPGQALGTLETGEEIDKALGLTGGGGGKKGPAGKLPSGSQVNSATVGSGASGVEAEILKTAMARGLSPNAAAGMVGNAAQESSLNPAVNEYGLYQTSGYGPSSGSAAEQTSAAIEKMGPSVIAAMNAAKSPAEAASIMMKQWEKPEGSQPGEESKSAVANAPHREQAATEAAKHIKSTDANTGALENNTKALGGTSSGTSGGSAYTEGSSSKAEDAQEKAAKAKEAAEKAALDKEVAGQEKALAGWTTKMVASETKADAERKAAIAQEITEHKSYIATLIADEKKGMSETQAAEKAKNAAIVKAGEAGDKELTKLQTAIAKGSATELNSALTKAHEGALKVIESKLDQSHKTALKELASKLEETWAAGVKKLAEVKAKEAYEASPAGKAAAEEKSNREQRELEEAFAKTPEGQHDAEVKAQEAKEAQEKLSAEESLKAQEKAETEKVEAINKQSKIESDKAESKAQEISDSTKVMLDKQAEVGLSGTAEIAAHLQTVFDEVTGEMDKQINAAKLAQDEAVGKGAVAEAEAAARTSKIENEAKLKEAEAQKALELAKATASASSAGPGVNIESLVINGPGMSSAELVGELGWSLKTGSLPVAQPQPAAP